MMQIRHCFAMNMISFVKRVSRNRTRLDLYFRINEKLKVTVEDMKSYVHLICKKEDRRKNR